MAQKLKTSQTRQHTVLPMVGNAADEAGDSVLSKIDVQLSKLFEDRNIMLVGGGIIAVNAGATSVSFTSNLRLHVNSLVAGGSPLNIDLASTTRAFTSDGNMLYAVINRSSGTAVVTADSTTLPAIVAANQEVVLIAKRIGTSIYFRNGVSITTNSSRTFDNTSLGLGSLNVSTLYQEGLSNDTASGSNVTLTSPTTPIVRLTAAGTLVSVDMIPAGSSGQIIKVINATGSAVNVNNEAGATAANRILTGTSGTLSLANNASILLVYDSTSSRWRILGGSGSGSGGSTSNYILSPSADTGAAGWITYADAAGTAPIDGTGGSPSVTFTTTASLPLRGLASFLYTKPASNVQGQGFSYDFTIDNADTGKVLQGSFEYQIASGTFADNDMSVWIYDITNARLIQPAPYLLKNSSLIEKFPFEFQTAINSTSYRLIVHQGSTSAVANTIKLDNFNVGPQAKLYGSAIVDRGLYTPTFAGLGGPTNANFRQFQIGNILRIEFSFGAGTVSGSGASFTLPPGLTADITAGTQLGIYSSQGSIATGALRIDAATKTIVQFGAANWAVSATGTQIGTSSLVTGFIEVPIVGWSSSQVMSSDASTRVVDFVGYVPSNQLLTAGVTNITLFAEKDSHGGWNGSQYLIQVPGDYSFNCSISSTAVTTAAIQIFNNGSTAARFAIIPNSTNSSGSVVIPNLKPGDLISFRSQDPFTTLAGSAGKISIVRISGPSQIMASESVSALYVGSPATGTLNSSFNSTTFGTKIKDSHNAYSGGSYIVPTSGCYDISASVRIASTFTVGQGSAVAISINGVVTYSNTVIQQVAGVYSQNPQINVKSIPLLAGQIITIQTSVDGSGPSYSSGTGSFFSITRSGNY